MKSKILNKSTKNENKNILIKNDNLSHLKNPNKKLTYNNLFIEKCSGLNDVNGNIKDSYLMKKIKANDNKKFILDLKDLCHKEIYINNLGNLNIENFKSENTLNIPNYKKKKKKNWDPIDEKETNYIDISNANSDNLYIFENVNKKFNKRLKHKCKNNTIKENFKNTKKHCSKIWKDDENNKKKDKLQKLYISINKNAQKETQDNKNFCRNIFGIDDISYKECQNELTYKICEKKRNCNNIYGNNNTIYKKSGNNNESNFFKLADDDKNNHLKLGNNHKNDSFEIINNNAEYDCIGFVCDEEYMCENFHFDEDHVESPDRIKCIIKELKEKSVINKMIQIKCREALFDEIKQCHSSRHINNIFYSLKKKLKYKKKRVIYPFDKHDTYYTSHTGIVSKRAIGGLLNLCDAILSDKNEKFKFIDFKKSILYNYNFFKNVSHNNINKYEGSKINNFIHLKRSESDSNLHIREKSKNNIFTEHCENSIFRNQDIYIEICNNNDIYYDNNYKVDNNYYKENFINAKPEGNPIYSGLDNIYNIQNYKMFKKNYRSYSTSMFNMNDCNNNNSFTDITCGFAAIRPPGHHCSKNNSSGFCIFNNISIACKYISKKYGIKKIFIFDWDVHHNNGTQEIFYSDKDVLCFSIHRFDKKKVKINKKKNNTKNANENSNNKNMKKSNKKAKKSCKVNEENLFFPCSGAKNELGDKNGYMFNINVPLEKGYNNCDVYYVFKYLLIPMLKKFQPEFIFISCGFDASVNDPLGECNLTHNLYHWMTLQLKNFANIFCNGRIILVLEGGYNLNYLPKCTLACIKALIKKNTNSKQENAIKKLHSSKYMKKSSKEILMNKQNNISFETNISNKFYSHSSTKKFYYNPENFLDKKTNIENTNVFNLDNFSNCINFNYNLNNDTQNNFYKLRNYLDCYNKSIELYNKDTHINTTSKKKKLLATSKLHYSTYKVIKYFSCILKGDPFHLDIKLPPYNYFIKKEVAIYKNKKNPKETITKDKLKMENKLFDNYCSSGIINLINLKENKIKLNDFTQKCIKYSSESSTTISNISHRDLCISNDETEYDTSYSSKNSKKKVIILNRLKLKIGKDINASSYFPIINMEKKGKEKKKKKSNYNIIENLNKNVETWDLTNLGNNDQTNYSEINDLNNSSINCDLTNLKYNEEQMMNSFKMYTKRKKGFIFFFGSGHKNQWILPVHKKITKIIKLCSESEAYFYAWLYLCCRKKICIAKTKENYSSILEDKEKICSIPIYREFSDDKIRLAKQFLKFTVPCYYVFLKENQINELNNEKITKTYFSIEKNLYDSMDTYTDKCISEILKSIHPIKKNYNSSKKNYTINPTELINVNDLKKNCTKEDTSKKNYACKQDENKAKSFKQSIMPTVDENIMNLHNKSYNFFKSSYNEKNNVGKNACITDIEYKNRIKKKKKKKKEKTECDLMNSPKKSLKKEKKAAICLSNVLSTMRHPCVIDIKMGIRLYGDNCNKESIQKKIEKAKNRSCLSHGFHLTSLIGWCKKKKKPFFISKEDAHSIKNDDDFVNAFISYFFACDNICLSILLIKKILLILERMKIFFENQNYFAFYGSSLLFVFDSDPSKNKSEYISEKNVNQINLLSSQDNKSKKETCINEIKRNERRKQEKNYNNERKNYEEIYDFKEEIEKLFEESLTNEEKKIYMDNKLNTKILKSADVYIIDFAHASLNTNEKDEGFLLGIISLHRILKKTIEKIKNFHLNNNLDL
ncbi:histone deacetylase 2, putative [Plasmodium relictum]|uniref:histone deacetylase n=1 Tax=Plasmodium relictum TaxID=85471 RepID=A0A1J1H3Z8_PLARL|nr:histone deacetylase 2, putative [Plasmodium relictum]CRG99631.1 histone deacetylase 2, putative [Plasmodium relictum]